LNFSRRTIHSFLIVIGLVILIASCQKDDDIATNPSYKLSFSTDTIIFDTVFTTIGSTIRSLKVYNRNDKKINISKIYLAEGNSSQYQINVDGTPVISTEDIEIAANDSMFIFIRVNVDPTDEFAPFVLSDSLLFETNGNLQDVNLVAWGQNADYFLGDRYIEGLSYPYTIIAREGTDTVWEDDKAKVIYGWAVVDSAASLTIGPGCNIHFHQNSGLWVYKGGSIHVNGEKDSLVTFQGDRLEYEFRDTPGQWDRIWINESNTNSEFNYAVIKNGYIGIQAETLSEVGTNQLELNNTRIENMTLWGLFTVAYKIRSTNSVFANCAERTLFISVGGDYDFRHCTFANYWNYTVRQDPSFVLSNNLIVYDANGNEITYIGHLQNAYFGNCLVYGSNSEELLYSENDQVNFNYDFDHCILKTEMDISDQQYINCLKNEDPLFVDYTVNNYRLDTLSPAIDIGSLEVINSSEFELDFDLDGNSRISDNGPDLGAYEFIPQ